MSEGEAKATKLHNPLHATIAVGVAAAACAAMIHQGVAHKYVFGLLLAITLGMLALEKINKAILVLLGSGLALLLAIWQGLLEKPDHGDSAHSLPVYIEMIDWGTLGIIIGSIIFVELISRGGLFTWIAV